MLDSQHHDRPYSCEGHYRDSHRGFVDGVLRRQSSKLPQDRSVIIAQTTNSSLALPTPIEHFKRVLRGEEVIGPTKVEKRQLMSKNGTDLPTPPTYQQLRESMTGVSRGRDI
jgi:hypothetical protein